MINANEKTMCFLFKKNKKNISVLIDYYFNNISKIVKINKDNKNDRNIDITSKDKTFFLLEIPSNEDEFNYAFSKWPDSVFVDYIFYINQKNQLVEVKNRSSDRKILEESDYLLPEIKNILNINSLNELEKLNESEINDKINLLKLNYGV